MRKSLFCLYAVWLCVVGHSVYGEEARLLRFPATNGEDIVFSHGGDLYRVPMQGGVAQRLTSHVGEEMFARYSPDGQWIAFTGQYDGNTEVYLMPAKGGIPRRLTYTATNARDDLGDRMGPNNIVMGWTPDGKVVYRNRIGSSFQGKLYLVDTAGTFPEELPFPEGGFCSYSPDGQKLAYNRVFREFRTWKRYTGGMADEIWIHNFKDHSTKAITHSKAQDIIPMWVGDKVYFISERNGTGNLWRVSADGTGTEEIVTDFSDYDVKFPSSHGTHIVYENGGYIYHYNTETGQNKRVHVELSAEAPLARGEYLAGAKRVHQVTFSGAVDSVVCQVRGDLFLVVPERGTVQEITRSPGAFDRLCNWSPTGGKMAYVSDESGEDRVYLYDFSTGKSKLHAQEGMGYVRGVEWSDDGQRLAVIDAKNNLWILEANGAGGRLLHHDTLSGVWDLAFSPDGRWIAYTTSGVNGKGQIWLQGVDSKERYTVSGDRYDAYSPYFSRDGKYLYFNSDRFFSPTYGWLEWNHVFDDMTGLYMVTLQKETLSPLADYYPIEEEKGEVSSDKKGKKKNSGAVSMRIDVEGLPDRVMHVPSGKGYHAIEFAKGNMVYYNRKGSAYSYDLENRKETLLLEGATLYYTPDGQKCLGYDGAGGRLGVLNAPGGKTTFPEAIDLSGLRVYVDYQAEWSQIFHQVWRVYRDNFYVENMHGVDWLAMREKYAVLLPYVTTRLDLNYLLGEMIAELNVGHAYVNPGEYKKAPRESMGLLGARLERVEDGKAYRIAHIWQGNGWDASLRSPLATPGLGVKEGDYIVAVDGVGVESVRNIYELLVGKANQLVALQVNSRPRKEGAKDIVVKTIGSESALVDNAWVERNMRYVDSVSGGRVGYVYVPDMGVDGLISFAKYYYPQVHREGLIIDDRYNGGGNISPMLIERLSREVYRVDMMRNSKRVGTTPDATHVGPKVCLINKFSASDGDLFPWSFRRMGLGKLIGTRTWGGIVGITASLPFMDGTDVRVPFFTNYDPQNGEWIIENEGVHPDIEVENDPWEEWNGRDAQLERAVQEVMEQLKDRKELPRPPAPRDWSK